MGRVLSSIGIGGATVDTILPEADIQPGDTVEFTPRSTPVTLGRQEVWLQTGLDIDWAVDPTDRDADP